ncbi:MAG: polyketide synthase, partial [Ketobacteraceae bacterium]|nr:polyketide synthase [Ketobacteraceae bacterium]
MHNDDMDNDAIDVSDIAIVGMACRFPGASNPDEFWDNLKQGVESITELSDDQLKAEGVSDDLLSDPNYVKKAAVLDKMEYFDAGFFNFSPLEATMMDPQHRQFLECTWEALENAGYDPARYDGAIGVFAGSGHNAYMPNNLFSNPQFMEQHGLFLVRHTGNDKDFLTTRASYCFNLTGPSVNVQTACSTSLVAMHGAIQSLMSHECDMA